LSGISRGSTISHIGGDGGGGGGARGGTFIVEAAIANALLD